MIRTVIEISAEDDWKFEQQIRTALDKLGYEPKQDADYGRFLADLRSALHNRGLDANKLVEEYRAKLNGLNADV